MITQRNTHALSWNSIELILLKPENLILNTQKTAYLDFLYMYVLPALLNSNFCLSYAEQTKSGL